MDMRISKINNDDGSIELYFEGIGHWDDCELIINILVNENQCLVINENDMITDKDVFMKFKDIEFLLRHDYMLGNFLYTTNKSDFSTLEYLANNVIESIKVKFDNIQK
ncbi:MAG: hypothetical protein BGN88_02415 [Clostridiales bacterium 43-6]|mgnify:CR=1 FL=1|nr:MAG: hypothetical protein BGN88_02415 [Clostridiales bacterium 43-6]